MYRLTWEDTWAAFLRRDPDLYSGSIPGKYGDQRGAHDSLVRLLGFLLVFGRPILSSRQLNRSL
jgi:hypothetical protein